MNERATLRKELAMDYQDHLLRLEEANRKWFQVKANKAASNEAFNRELKEIESDMETLLGEISDDRTAQKLPFGREVDRET